MWLQNKFLCDIMMSMSDTICAISTPLGRGAISIVRLSGKASLPIMRELFYCKKLEREEIQPRYMYFGDFLLSNGSKEKCLCVFFKNPFSYTGEDMVEFQIHGGTLLTQLVLESVQRKGARLAEAGEFTKRAFENGKISLDMAESIIGEINAESEGELRASLHLAQGYLAEKIKKMQSSLTEMLAEIEATLDYPEEDFEEATKEKIFKKLKNALFELKNYQNSQKNGKLLQEGVKIVIVGSTNVGKSSTLNALLGEDRAIVTDIEGTTRDVLSESISYKGIRFNFIDTAGIRDSSDKIESLGIERSKQSIDEANVLLCLLDGSRKLNENDKNILKLVKDKQNVIYIVNKSDLPRVLEKFEGEIEISALNDKNIDEIKERIFGLVCNEKIDYNQEIIISSRQAQYIDNAIDICNNILNAEGESMDIIAMLIKNLWNELGKITGECENESIIDLIFSKFCLGK